jgi:hypothetical protein
MNKRVGKKRIPQEDRGHNLQCRGIPNAKSKPNPLKVNRPEEGWLKVTCVCLFMALSLIVKMRLTSI